MDLVTRDGGIWRRSEIETPVGDIRETVASSLGAPQTWPAEVRDFGAAWSHEDSPQLSIDGLLWIAARAESQHPQWAARCYDLLRSSPTFSSFTSETRRASERLNALQGNAASGEFWEIAGSRFVQETTDPKTIAAFSIGALAFKSARLLTGTGLASMENGFLLNRGRGLAISANLAGWAAETTALSAGSELLQGLTGSTDMRSASWSQTAMMLGLLRLSSLGTAPFAKRVPWIAIGASYGGLALIHAANGDSNPLLAGLSDYFHFQVAGRISHHLLGRELFLHDNLPARRQSPLPFDLAPRYAFASETTTRGLAPREPVKGPMILQMASINPITFAAGSSGFAAVKTVKTIRSPLGKGQTFLDIGTRQKLEKNTFAKLIVDLEDGFSSLLNDYHTRETNLLRGPIGHLLRADPQLRAALLDHAGVKQNRIWALIDADTGFIQRIVALDHSSRPTSVLAMTAISLDKTSPLYQVFSLHYDFKAAGDPSWSAQRWLFSGKKNALIEIPDEAARDQSKLEANSNNGEAALLHGRLFNGAAHQLDMSLNPQHPGVWDLRLANDKILFRVTPAGRPGLDLYQWSAGETHQIDEESQLFRQHRHDTLAPPAASAELEAAPLPPALRPTQPAKALPVEAPPALAPQAASPERETLSPPAPQRSSSNAMPPPPSERMPKTKIPKSPAVPKDIERLTVNPAPTDIDAIKKKLAEIHKSLTKRSDTVDQRIYQLRLMLQASAPEELRVAQQLLDDQLPVWFAMSSRADHLIGLFTEGLSPTQLAKRSMLVADLLVSGDNPTRAGAFEFFRDSIANLDRDDAKLLKKYLETNYPLKNLSASQRLLVQQVHIRLDEQLSAPLQ